jgi:hypothetical protein
MGAKNVEGKVYNALGIKVNDTNITLLLDQKTNYPVIMRFSKSAPRQGKTVTVENHYSDWKTSNGVAYPYSQVTLIDGNKTAEMTVKSHQPNK